MCVCVCVCVCVRARRWNDAVSRDLKKCKLSSTWREQAQEHQSWRTVIKHGVEGLNRQAEEDEKQTEKG